MRLHITLGLVVVQVLLSSAAIADTIQLRCHMNACRWADFQSINHKKPGDDGGTLYEVIVTYGSSVHPDVGRVEGATYPEEYSSQIPIQWGDPTAAYVYCSYRRPTIFSVGYEIRTFGFPEVVGAEESSAHIYLWVCHDFEDWPNRFEFEQFGYRGLARQEFASVTELLGPTTPLYQSTEDLFYRVVDVAENDVLNIRAEPTSSSKVVGALAHNDPLVEITGKVGNWFRVNAGEQTGWVFSRYLELVNLPTIPETNLPQGITCFGEEPFWTLTILNGQIVFDWMGQEEEFYQISQTSPASFGYLFTAQSSTGDRIEVEIIRELTTSSMVGTYFNWKMAYSFNGQRSPWTTGCGM